MEQMTVKDLLKLCMHEYENGNGDRKILISDDNEGNGFHGLFFPFTEIEPKEAEMYVPYMYDTQETDINKVLILG